MATRKRKSNSFIHSFIQGRGVNPGGWGRDPQILSWGDRVVVLWGSRGKWTGLEKHYGLHRKYTYVRKRLFYKKERKINSECRCKWWIGEYLGRKDNFVSWRQRKKVVKTFEWKIGHFFRKISATGFTTSRLPTRLTPLIQSIFIGPLQVHYYIARILWRNLTPKRRRQLRGKDLPKVPMWRLKRDSNPRPFRRKAPDLPMSHHAPQLKQTVLVK